MIAIYLLKDPRTMQVRYVGKSEDVDERYRQHLRTAKKGKTHRARWIASLLAKEMTPVLEIIETITEGNWKEREMFWIQKYRQDGADLTNSTNGGEGVQGFRHTLETKEKLSKMQKGRKLTEEWRANVSAGLRVALSNPEIRRKISIAGKGRRLTSSHRAKLSAARKGMRFTETHCQNISKGKAGSVSPTKGVSLSREQKVAVSKAHRSLTDEDAQQILLLIESKTMRQVDIAKRFGVCEATITYLKKNGGYFTARMETK